MNLTNKMQWLSESLSVWDSGNNTKILTLMFENADREFQMIDIWKATRIPHEAMIRGCLTTLRYYKWLTSRRAGKEVFYKANEEYFLKVKSKIELL